MCEILTAEEALLPIDGVNDNSVIHKAHEK